MSRLHKEVIQRLSGNEETRSLALHFLSTASLYTGPGTGYDLREGVSGLPAMCTYLASEESGNGDVAEKVAQTASCLAPKVWRTALKTVRGALQAAAAKQQEDEARPLVYEDLIAQNRLGRAAFVATNMNDIEKALLKTGLLPQEFHPPNDVLKVSIFVWVCHNLMRMKKITPEAILQEYDVPRRDYDDIADILESSCQSAAQKVRRKVEELRARKLVNSTTSATPTTQPNTSPERSPSASPSRPAVVAGGGRGASLSPHKTPTHKRKVAFAELDDVDPDLLDTPSKRPRTASPAKPKPTPAGAHAESAQPSISSATLVPNPDAISPSKASRPAAPQPPPLAALTMPKPSIFPSTKAASAQSPLDLLAQRSSSRSPFNSSSPGRPEPAVRPQTRSQTGTTPRPAPPAPVAGPSTPSRQGRPPKVDGAACTPTTPARTTPAQKRTPAALAALDDEEEDRPRRFRHVFLDQIQWFQRDPRAGQWRSAESRKDKGSDTLAEARKGRQACTL
ncbi:hypothetical protein DAEQUDRAFT_807950, partial [Daedalea quercina L-15889]